MVEKIEDFSKYCQVVGNTDVGCNRQVNEDYLGSAETCNGLIATVCDGMGGHAGGATASKTAVKTILDFLKDNYFADPREAITAAINEANNTILEKAAAVPELRGMGSTCVLLLVRKGKVYIGHVGDSRIYLIRSSRIKQLTKDHSYVQMLVDTGQISKEQAEHHPRKNEITNALGLPDMQPATVFEDVINPEAGDCFLLCSDGLSGMVSDDSIMKIVSRQREMRASERVNMLIEKARQNGGLDNITAQIVEFSVTPGQGIKQKNTITKIVSITIIISIIIVCTVLYWGKLNKEGGGLPQHDDSSKPEYKEEKYKKYTKDVNLEDLIIKDLSSEYLLSIEFSQTATTISTSKESVWEEAIEFNIDSTEVVNKLVHMQKSQSNILLLSIDSNNGVPDREEIVFLLKNDKNVEYKFSIIVKKETASKEARKSRSLNRVEEAPSAFPEGSEDDKTKDPEAGVDKKNSKSETNAEKSSEKDGFDKIV